MQTFREMSFGKLQTEQLTDNIFNAKKIDWIEIYIMYFVPDYILYIGTLCYVNAEI